MTLEATWFITNTYHSPSPRDCPYCEVGKILIEEKTLTDDRTDKNGDPLWHTREECTVCEHVNVSYWTNHSLHVRMTICRGEP